MTYLDPADFRIGNADQGDGLALAIKQDGSGPAILVRPAGEEGWVIYPGWAEAPWQTFGLGYERGSVSTIIEGIRVEVDVLSGVEANSGGQTGGILRRMDGMLLVGTKAQDNGGFNRFRWTLLQQTGIDQAHAKMDFQRWRLVIGTGEQRQVLLAFDGGRIVEVD